MRRKQQSEPHSGSSKQEIPTLSLNSAIPAVCRLCGLHSASYFEIFGDRGTNNKRNLPALVKEHLNIVIIDSNKFSRFMCTNCCCQLETFHQFSNRVKQVQKLLKQHVSSIPKIESDILDQETTMHERVANADRILNEASIDLSSDKFDEVDGPVKIQLEEKKSEQAYCDQADECANETGAKTSSDDEEAEMTAAKRSKTKEQEQDLAEFYNLVCHKCGTNCQSFAKLSNHCKELHDCVPVITCQCGKSLERRTHLLRHRNQHLGVHRYKCEMCQRGFHFKFMLRAHMYTHGPDSDKPFECDECHKKYITKSALVSHRVSKHAPPKDRVSCEICGNTFSHPNCLYTHKRTVHGNQRHFVCHVCGKTMSTLGNLKGHLETHKESCNIQCEFCGKRFKTRMRLVRHKEYHNAVVHECSVCGKKCQTRGSLRAHLLVHSDQRPHKCNLCPKSFKLSKQLKLHWYQHTGERPYKCPHCPKTFTNAGNRATHKRRMHANYTSGEGVSNEVLHANSTTHNSGIGGEQLQSVTAVHNDSSMTMGVRHGDSMKLTPMPGSWYLANY